MSGVILVDLGYQMEGLHSYGKHNIKKSCLLNTPGNVRHYKLVWIVQASHTWSSPVFECKHMKWSFMDKLVLVAALNLYSLRDYRELKRLWLYKLDLLIYIVSTICRGCFPCFHFPICTVCLAESLADTKSELWDWSGFQWGAFHIQTSVEAISTFWHTSTCW